jgi:hypothetical protein
MIDMETDGELVAVQEYSKVDINKARFDEIANSSFTSGGSVVVINLKPIRLERDGVEELLLNGKLLAYKDAIGYYEVQN